MARRIKCRLQGKILHFEIMGSIGNHIDSIAKYVVCAIAKWKTENVLLDLRSATGRPGPARLFIHVLRYPFLRHINCALIDRKNNHEFVSLYLELMRHRGHRIEFFACPEEGEVWLTTEATDHTTSHDRHSPPVSGGVLGKILDVCVRAKTGNKLA
jgi:hypothetical protein